MRALSSFLGVLASLTTMGAVAVRMWWSKPRTRSTPPVQDSKGEWWLTTTDEPRAPSWLRTAAKWWLITVVFGATIIFLIVVIYTLISLS